MEQFEELKGLSGLNAVTGFEGEAAEYVKKHFAATCDSVEVDAFHNVIGLKKGTGKGIKILVTAHFDEIGLLVKGLDDRGFVKVTSLGGVDGKILLAQEVTVHGKRDLFGVIGAKPPHLLKPEETKKAVKLEDLYIDLGMKGDEVKELVSIGDPITLRTRSRTLNGKRFSGKALDNRASIAVMLEILKGLKDKKHEADIYFVATTQEEFNASGATVAAYHIQPDFAVVLDTCHGEIPDIPKEDAFPLGKGPAVGLGPNMHRKLTQSLMALAKAENIPCQVDVEPEDSGTEAWNIQVSRAGIPTVLISIPLKYMHTPIETVHLEDLKNTAALVERFVSRPGLEMEGSLCY